MPLVKIEECRTRTAQEKAQLVAVIFDALKATLGVTDDELQARYCVFAPDDFFVPRQTTDYLAIEISLFAGRSLDAKRRLYSQLVHDVAAMRDIDPSDVLVLLREESIENWGMRGGHAAIDLRFNNPIAI